MPLPTMTASPEPDDDTLADALRRSRVLEDAPEALIQRAMGVFQPRAAARSGASLLQRLGAVLSFDSAAGVNEAGGLALGLRAAAEPGDTRQLLFTSEGRDIDLRISPGADGLHWDIRGQVLGPDGGGMAELMAGTICLQTAWNELAEFGFEQVPAGDCSLVLRSADWELVLPSFQTAERS